jgi:hypothetical protein
MLNSKPNTQHFFLFIPGSFILCKFSFTLSAALSLIQLMFLMKIAQTLNEINDLFGLHLLEVTTAKKYAYF